MSMVPPIGPRGLISPELTVEVIIIMLFKEFVMLFGENKDWPLVGTLSKVSFSLR